MKITVIVSTLLLITTYTTEAAYSPKTKRSNVLRGLKKTHSPPALYNLDNVIDKDLSHAQLDGLEEDQVTMLRKAVKEFNAEKDSPILSKELIWLERQCTGELCTPLRKFLVELPSKTKSKLSETLQSAGVTTKRGQLALTTSKARSARLVKMIQHILQANKLDEFQMELAEELAEGFDTETFNFKLEGQEVKLERIGDLVFMDHDVLVAQLSKSVIDPDLEKMAMRKDLTKTAAMIHDPDSPFFGVPMFNWPFWFDEEVMKAIRRLLQGNIDYWPVKTSGSGRRVDVPYKIQTDLTSAKREDVADALSRMCLETALPLPGWMESNNFVRTLVTGLTSNALREGTKSCKQIVDGINSALGINMGTTFLLNLIPRTTQTSYINFKSHASKCSSPVGMKIGGPNNVNVASWCQVGSLMHETLHSLGFYHQQSRMDRDSHVDVLWGNIQDDKEHNYAKRDFLHGGVPYDFFSILHYSRINGFSIGGQPTMNADPAGIAPGWLYDLMVAVYNGAMGQRQGLSAHDMTALHNVY